MDKLKIGLIHATMNSVGPILESFSSTNENVDLVNFMDEGLIYELNETNTVTTRMILRLSELAGKAVESHVDAILFTCSSFTPFVPKIAELVSVPVLSSDISMLEKAVELSEKINVIATVNAAGPTTKRMIEEVAKQKGKEVTVEARVLTEAFEALQKGNPKKHDQLIQREIENIGNDDVTVLAQYSMARAVANDNLMFDHVLTGPQVSAEAIINLAREYRERRMT
ncbi:aspartate/glutamate racemase family protein [Alkalihalobacillus clausii]|jgi:Asp/Glu/hydantoin racemase|uniref:aspartate/glutamate racemase family protein n=1 Tax=Shouchella clausii TaxID=79880 RepID=UPI00203CF617|nr:aspartate/glutamate racemase family protein [Shouchella clausii]MCM3550781.1 aspartate/glutamate racemase family protein [Shouchella clausii]